MPPNKGAVYDFFIKNPNGVLICQCPKRDGDSEPRPCGAEFTNDHEPNLERHVKRFHDDSFEVIKKRKNRLPKNNSIDEEEPSVKQQRLSKNCDLKWTLTVKISPKDIDDAAVQLVVCDGRPLSAVEDVGFKSLVGPYYEALDRMKVKYEKMTRYRVATLITERAKNLRQTIKKKTEKKMISLKLDAAMRKGRSFLGINAQFYSENTFYLFTLGCVEFKESQTGRNILMKVKEILKEFGISMEQIYSITTDNGANFVSSVNTFNASVGLTMNEPRQPNLAEASSSQISEMTTEPELNDSQWSTFSSIGEVDVEVQEYSESDDDELGNLQSISALPAPTSVAPTTTSVASTPLRTPPSSPLSSSTPQKGHRSSQDKKNSGQNKLLVDESAEIENILSEIEIECNVSDGISGIRCSAHTLQLAVYDTVRDCKMEKAVLEKCRGIVKSLRTKNFSLELEKTTKLKPILDCATR